VTVGEEEAVRGEVDETTARADQDRLDESQKQRQRGFSQGQRRTDTAVYSRCKSSQ